MSMTPPTMQWHLVPTDPALALGMGDAYLDAAESNTPGGHWRFSHAGYRAMLAVAPQPPDPLPLTVELIADQVAQAIGADAYDCTRVWHAWGVGTMSEDDFVPLAQDSDRVAEIAQAALDACMPSYNALRVQLAEVTHERDMARRQRATLADKLATLQEGAAPAVADDDATPESGADLATVLVRNLSQLRGAPLPWADAIEITATVTRMPPEEKARLLAMGEADQ